MGVGEMTFWSPLGPLDGPDPPVGGLPDGPWPLGSPESQGMDGGILRTVRGIQHGVVIRHGIDVFTWGDPDRVLDWASCNRTDQDKLWGKWVTQHGLDWLDRDVSDLPCAAAHHAPNPAPLKTVCSYTSLPWVGNIWRYSCGPWWPWQASASSDLFGCLDVAQAWAMQIQPWMGGSTFRPGVADDGTLRIKASVRDKARTMGLVRTGGVGTHGVRLISADYIARGIAGGPDGNGYPFAWEAYQTHLCRQGRANAGSSQNSPQWIDLPGVPDGCLALDGGEDLDHGWGAVVWIPSLDLIVSARGATPAWWLPTIVAACVG